MKSTSDGESSVHPTYCYWDAVWEYLKYKDLPNTEFKLPQHHSFTHADVVIMMPILYIKKLKTEQYPVATGYAN